MAEPAAGARRGRVLLRLLAALGLILASAAPAQSLILASAEALPLQHAALRLSARIELGAVATEALQSGLSLSYRVDWHLDHGPKLSQTLRIRYSPLLRRYTLLVAGNERSYSLRNALLAALENATVSWPEAACSAPCSGRVRMRLDISQLPAPLRLPALFDGDWQFDSGWRRSEVVGPAG